MISNPLVGGTYFIQGLSLITKPGIRKWVIVPLLINFLLFTVMFWWAFGYFDALISEIMPGLPEWLAWLNWLLWIVFALTAAIVFFFSFTLVANLVGAPFNSYLAAAVEEHLSGKKPEGSNRGIMADIIHAVKGELKKWLYYLAWLIPLLIITIIPGVNLIAPVCWALYGAWMLSLEYVDYPMGNHGYIFPNVRKQVQSKSIMSLGFGGAVTLGTMIPIFNFIVMPVAVAGATLYWHNQLKEQ